MTWLILVVLAASALTGLYLWERRADRRRREALRRAAVRVGLVFDPKARLFHAHPDLRELHVFRDRPGELLNTMRGAGSARNCSCVTTAAASLPWTRAPPAMRPS